MSESLAVFRRTQNHELADLAEQHIKHDLTDTDRTALKSAASRVSTATMIGTLAGLGLGAFLAFRVRSNRQRMFQAFRAQEKPTKVVFASGREEAIPDVTPLLKPSTFGDVMTYLLFASGGLLLGGELGLLTGGALARSSINSDEASRQRIEKAFRAFRIDVLKTQIAMMEGDNSIIGQVKRQLDN